MVKAERYGGGLLIHPGLDKSIARNINGPSLIRVPDWLDQPLGRYYLYFADHHGSYIRLAYADSIHGPWQIHLPGSLKLEETPCISHIASPDVHVDNVNKKIIMYYHGPVQDKSSQARFFKQNQLSFYAESRDGLQFVSDQEALATSYLRVFFMSGSYYGLSMPGYIFQSADGRTGFKLVKRLFTDRMRHSAVLVRKEKTYVFYTDVGDRPEHLVFCQLLGDQAKDWTCSERQDLLFPEMDYEGASLPLENSVRGFSPQPVRELRDPAVFQEKDKTYLLYTVKGEFGIALAELAFPAEDSP